MHIAVTSGAMATMTPMLLQTALNRQETINVTRIMFLSLFPVIFTIFSPMISVTPVWNKDAPTTIMAARRTIVVLL